jgi:hypothetical protein
VPETFSDFKIHTMEAQEKIWNNRLFGALRVTILTHHKRQLPPTLTQLTAQDSKKRWQFREVQRWYFLGIWSLRLFLEIGNLEF